MKVVALREAKQQLSGCVVRAQRERVLNTKQGRPVALMIGGTSRGCPPHAEPAFLEMIEARRTEPTLGLDEVRRRLLVPPPRRRGR